MENSFIQELEEHQKKLINIYKGNSDYTVLENLCIVSVLLLTARQDIFNNDANSYLNRLLNNIIDKLSNLITETQNNTQSTKNVLNTISSQIDTVIGKAQNINSSVTDVKNSVNNVGSKMDNVGEKVDNIGVKIDKLAVNNQAIGDIITDVDINIKAIKEQIVPTPSTSSTDKKE